MLSLNKFARMRRRIRSVPVTRTNVWVYATDRIDSAGAEELLGDSVNLVSPRRSCS